MSRLLVPFLGSILPSDSRTWKRIIAEVRDPDASAVKCHATRSVQPASEKENLGAVAGAKFHERIFEFNRPADLIRSRI